MRNSIALKFAANSVHARCDYFQKSGVGIWHIQRSAIWPDRYVAWESIICIRNNLLYGRRFSLAETEVPKNRFLLGRALEARGPNLFDIGSKAGPKLPFLSVRTFHLLPF